MLSLQLNFLKRQSCSVTQAGMQWCLDLPGTRDSSSLSFPSTGPQCKLHLLGSSDSPLPSQVAGTTGTHHHTQLIVFVFLVEMGVCHVGQAGFELLTSGDPLASVSQSAGITSVSHCTWPVSLNYSNNLMSEDYSCPILWMRKLS